jgi:hypothetical protein
MGLMQGEILSLLLFALNVNDFEINSIRNNCPSIELHFFQYFSTYVYADDMVIIPETPVGLQNMLDTLYDYSKD